MNKILLITKREYLTRVRKKSFIIMTILSPVLMTLLFLIPIWLATKTDNDEKRIAIIDQSHKFSHAILETENLKIDFIENKTLDQLQAESKDGSYYAVMKIPVNFKTDTIAIYSYKQPSLEIKSYLVQSIQSEVQKQNLIELNIDLQDLSKSNTPVNVTSRKWTEQGKYEKSYTEVSMGIGFLAAIIIYMFIFIYGAQVMRGVMEEKMSRIVEIIVSSVKPFQLMMGKIFGVALVALTQFSLWGVLTGIFIFIAKLLFLGGKQKEVADVPNSGIISQLTANSEFSDIFTALLNIDFGLLIFCLIFFFIGGYLLYASLFAAIGSAVDNETDTQQFMLPITIPLILSFIMAESIISNPDGAVAFWFSIIPLTSPIVMMVRLAIGVPEVVPYWQLILSMVLLVLAFLGTTWFASKIYRTGILLYGKKITYKELWKWLRYK